MKTISIIFLLFFSFGTFGQSAKKMNKKLLADFALEQQKQDSALAIFNHTKLEFDSIKKITNKKIYELSDLESPIKRLMLKVSDLINDLKALGIDPNSIVSDYSKKDGFPNYRDVVRPIKETLKEEVKFDQVSNRLYLDMYKLKEQNVMLTEKVNEYRDYSKTNSIHQRDLEANRDELMAFIPKLDSLSRVYQLLGNELATKRTKLLDKTFELRGNYMEKGPDGFPEAYRRVFYDAFPPKQNETIDEAIENIHVELADSYAYDPPPAEIAPVKEDIFSYVEEPASFPGGVEAMKTFIAKNLKYQESMKEANIQGKVFLKFIVSETGEISDVKILKGLPDCKECDMEAMRVVKAMPKWIPGKNNGKSVKSFYNLPVPFKLN